MTGELPPLQRSGRADFEWGLQALREYGEKRAQDTVMLLGQEAIADMFDSSWPDEQKIRFVAEIDAGILPPERKQARLMTLPPELAGPIAEADAARGAARAAYDLGKTFGSERGRDAVSVFGRGGQAVKPVIGAMRGMGLGAVEGFFKEGSDESEGLRRTLDTDDVAMWREAQAFAKEGKSPLGPAVKTKGLLPEDREVELYFEGAKAGYAEATGKAPSATTIGEITEGVGGLAGFVFGGPGKFIGAGGAAFKLLAGKAASKGVQLLLGMAGRAAGYAGYQAVLPIPQEDLAYVEEARAAGGDEAAAKLETDLRALRAIQGAAMWPVLEVVGGATGTLGKALGATKEGARGVAGKVAGGAATGAGFTAGEAVLDLPVMQAVSEAMVGRDPGVRSAFGKAILHTLDGHPDALAAWKEAGLQMGTGAAVFGAFHGLGAFSRGANLPLELQERVLGLQTRLGAEAREELRSKGVDPEVADRLVQVEGERPERVTVSTGEKRGKKETPPSEESEARGSQRSSEEAGARPPTDPRGEPITDPGAGKRESTRPREELREETPKERERRAAQTEETAPTRERLRELREELDAREERTPEVERAREDAGKAEELLAAGRVGEAERALEDAEVRLYTGKRPVPAEPDPVPHEAEVRRADMEAAIEVAPREPGGKPERITITPSTVSEGMLEVELPRGPQGSRRRMLVNSVEEALEMVRERNPEADVSLRGPLAQEVQVAEQRRTEAQAETRARRKALLEAAEPAREQAKVARRAATEERLKAELTAGLKDAVRDLKAQASKAKGSERARLVAEALAKAKAKPEPRSPEENKTIAQEQRAGIDHALSGRTTEAERQLADAMKREDEAAVSQILREYRDIFGGRPARGAVQAEAAQPEPRSAPAAPERGGATSVIRDTSGRTYPSRYEIVDERDLVTSHGTDLKPTAGYPQEQFQARRRESAEGKAGMERIEKELQESPEMFVEPSTSMTIGTPTVWRGPKGQLFVIAGNGRAIALRRTKDRTRYQESLETAAKALGLSVEDYGKLSPADLRAGKGEHLRRRVLVRVVKGTREEAMALAAESNKTVAAAQSPMEEAQTLAVSLKIRSESDVRLESPPTEQLTGENVGLFEQRNNAFVQRVMGSKLDSTPAAVRADTYSKVMAGMLPRSVRDAAMAAGPAAESAVIGAAGQLIDMHRRAGAGTIRADYDLVPLFERAIKIQQSIASAGSNLRTALSKATMEARNATMFEGAESPLRGARPEEIGLAIGLDRATDATNPSTYLAERMAKLRAKAVEDNPRQAGMFAGEKPDPIREAFGPQVADMAARVGKQVGRKPLASAQGEAFGGLPLMGWLKNLPDLLFARTSAVESPELATLHTRRQWAAGKNGIERWAHRWLKDNENRYGEVVAGPQRKAVLDTVRDYAKVMQPLMDRTTGIGAIKPRSKLSALFHRWAHSAGKGAEEHAADGAKFKAELAKKLPKLDADAMLETWRQTMSKALRLIHRMHPKVIGKGGFKDQIRTAAVSLQNARRSLSNVDKLPASLRAYHRARLEKAIPEYEQKIDTIRKDWAAFRSEYGYEGNYVPLIYEMARESDFVRRSEETWFTKRQAKRIGVQSMKRRSTERGKEGYVEDIWFAATRYLEPLLWKLHGQRAIATLDPIVEGVNRPLGKPYESKLTGETVDPFDTLRVGQQISHGPNGVRIVAIDRTEGARSVTVRPTSFKDSSADVVLPEKLAQRELMRPHGGLKQLVKSGEGGFLSAEYDLHITDFLRRNDRYVAKTMDRLLDAVSRHAASHGAMAILSAPVSWANNLLASLVTRTAFYGPLHALKGYGMLASAGFGNREYRKVLRDVAAAKGSEINKMIGLRDESSGDRSMLTRASDVALTPWKAMSAGFQASEKSNKWLTSLTAYSRARAEGKTYPEAISFARLAVAQTDFWFVPAMSPGVLTHRGTRPFMALTGAPLRMMNKLTYQWGAARTLDAAKGTTFMDYLAGKTDHYNVPMRYAVMSAIAVGMARAFLGTDVSHLFGSRKTVEVAQELVPGMKEFFAYAEETLGIPEDAWFVPGFFGEITEGGFLVDLVGSIKTALTSEEQEKADIFWSRVAPMLVGRLPMKVTEAFWALQHESPGDPEMRQIKHPDSPAERLVPFSEPTGHVQEELTPERLLARLVIPGSPLERVALYASRREAGKEAKRDREEAESINRAFEKSRRRDLSAEQRAAAAKEYRELMAGSHRRRPRLSRERLIAANQFTDLERVVIRGSAEVQAKNLIRYMAEPKADPAKLNILARLVFGEDANISRETRRAYIEARRKFLERAK